MRVLIINPNSSEDVTARIAAAAARVAGSAEVFDAVSAPSDTPLIVTQADAEHAASAVAEIVGERAADYDGVIIASFGDTGIDRARQITSRPVIGIARSAFVAALACADSFSIVSFSAAMAPGFETTLNRYGLMNQMRDIVSADTADIEVPGAMREETEARILAACQRVAAEGSPAIVLGGGPLAGLAHRLRGHLSVPIFDGVEASIAMLRLRLASGSGHGVSSRS